METEITTTACVAPAAEVGTEVPAVVTLFLYLLAYVGILVAALAAIVGGALFLAHRFQRCPCPLCTGIYEKETKIGQGSFGEVWMCRGSEGGRYAVKSIPITGVLEANRGMEEATQLARCQHQNLLNIERQFFHNERVLLGNPFTLCIVTELCIGDLREWTHDQEAFEERDCLHLGTQLLEGLHALHAGGTLHGDIKPENILISAAGSEWWQTRYKIADFGLSQRVDEIHSGYKVGTRGYMAPEVQRGSAYSYAVDVWSTGIVLLECMWLSGVHVEVRPSTRSEGSMVTPTATDLFRKAFGAGESLGGDVGILSKSDGARGGADDILHAEEVLDTTLDVVEAISKSNAGVAVEFAKHRKIEAEYPRVATIVQSMLILDDKERPECFTMLQSPVLQGYLSQAGRLLVNT